MDVKLVVKNGKYAGKELPVAGPKFVIGRAQGCQLRPSSDDVAPEHCTLLVAEGKLLARDMNTPAGTFVNGEKISGQKELKAGDELRVGPLTFEVRIVVEVGGKKKPKVTNVREAAARTVATSNDDLDISQWLSDTEPAETESPAYRTRGSNADEPRVPQKKVAHNDAIEPMKFFGEPTEAKPTQGTSKDAASEILKQMLGGKAKGR
jgi:predicted component of type VI protein secretion system